ncbi:MAG: bifunctional DNA-formamidopyrimidine glycosylase/DNA-(apurinic or apyrimidinic site) lyase [Acidobacteria bacterium]|nr:bifunctional DNA-formamidopyrimidine glycosylase/DNA-(apurinic or apyrimidinic site) lyase [Acidobacteriota bacterium]
MPELPEVEAVRQMLLPVMRGRRITQLTLHRDGLRRPFDEQLVDRVSGQRVDDIERRGKHLLMRLSSGDVVAMHLGMSGDFRIEPAGGLPDEHRQRHDHVVFELPQATVVFSDPRRFGAMDLLRPGESHAAIEAMGPEPLSAAFTADSLAAACRGRRTPIKVALLDQSVVAGVGNIYASEALHHARVSPKKAASALATATGRPRPIAVRIVDGVRAVLTRAIAREEKAYRAGRFRVYEREGSPCPRRGCGGTITRIVQTGRSTYYCPRCQH